MTRKKVKLAYITNDTSRRASFKKRKKGLIKKVSELSTLCDVDACVIIFGTYDREPELWPSRLGVQRVLSRFAKLPELQQGNKMANQESFTKERIRKLEEKLRKHQLENRQKEMTHFMFWCLGGGGMHGFNLADLKDMGWLVDLNMRDISRRIDSLKVKALPRGTTMVRGLGGGWNGMEAKMGSEMAVNAMENYQWNRDLLIPNLQLCFDWDETFMPYGYKNDGRPGPSFVYP